MFDIIKEILISKKKEFTKTNHERLKKHWFIQKKI